MSPKLIYCAGGSPRFTAIALEHNFLYGAQLPSSTYAPLYFADQDWKNPNRAKYMKELEEHKPSVATVIDYTNDVSFDEVMSWADEASKHVKESIIIIPKVPGTIDAIPETINGKKVILGYSVPSLYGATDVPTAEFGRRPVHLLGGNPMKQFALRNEMNVVSIDGNYAQKVAAQFCIFFANNKQGYKTLNRNKSQPNLKAYGLWQPKDGMYLAFKISCINITIQWQGALNMVVLASEDSIKEVQQLSRKFKQELGFVMLPSLKRAVEEKGLWLAYQDNKLVGFMNTHKRRDGITTIYEIAVDKDYQRAGVGLSLLTCVTGRLRVKTTQDNVIANNFYLKNGFILIEVEEGRKRKLNVYERA